MFKILLAVLLVLGLHQSLQAQISATAALTNIPSAHTADARQLAAYIKQNYSTDTSRIRAIYAWITQNINYDIVSFNARNTTPQTAPQSVQDVLKSRKAVCQGYADLFVELCNAVGIKAYFVGGYTKRDGAIVAIPHAWASVELEGGWYLFDPTWGAGYVQDNQFVRSPNFRYYKVAPAQMILDHMPFDPMYQFLIHPVTNKEFIEGQTGLNTSKQPFHFEDTLKQFVQLSPEEKMKSEAWRLEANGIRNDMLLQRLAYLKTAIEPFAFNDAQLLMKRAVDLFNQYINHKNNLFASLQDQQLRQMIDSVSHYISTSRSLLQKVNPKDDAMRQMTAATFQNMEKFTIRVMKEKEFVTNYLATDKAARRPLFNSR